VRVIAATNRNIPALIKAQRFREDLFYRLNTLAIGIAPLRERPEDLRPLAEHFLAAAALAGETASRTLYAELIDALALLPLYGNARELRNLVVRAAARKVGGGTLGLNDLPPDLWHELSCSEGVAAPNAAPERPVPATEIEGVDFPVRIAQQHGWKLSACLAHCEREIVEAAMRQVDYKQSQAARLLGLTPRSIYNKVRKYHLSRREIRLS
jgi:DNA-binding NtrC family response regulator